MNLTRNNDDSWIPNTPSEWFSWLTKEDSKTRKAYLAKPAILIADYRKENDITRDYEGREILELLQNAADQAAERDENGRVIIELKPEGLVVANTGMPFSVGGVLSLETAHMSPKRCKRKHFIGNKGLGFRSVLNWSHSAIILSGSLSLTYNPFFSAHVLSELISSSAELNRRVEEERGDSEDLVLPLLPFPGFEKFGEIEPLVTNNAAMKLLVRGRELKDSGYDTVVIMPFDQPGAFDAAKRQIDNLRPEILLFVNHLVELNFSLPDMEQKKWQLEGSDELSLVMEDKVPLGMWQVHRMSDILPEEQLDKDQKGPLNYEIVIAVPDIMSAEELKSSPLFSHFPTEIELPLPVVCHASLELNQSRNHTQQRKSNGYVLKKLAAFLAEVAERHSIAHPCGLKAGFRLLMPLKSFPNDLLREGFPEQLINDAKKRAIVPTLSGNPSRADEARLVKGGNKDWLPPEFFPEVASIFEAEEESFFGKLAVPTLDDEELKTRLGGLDSLSITDRAKLISGLLEHQIDKSVYSSSLLIDSDGDLVPDDASVFLAPSGGTTLGLPAWMDLHFLNADLRKELISRLGAKDVRDLQGKLSSFGLLEYSLANLIRRLNTAGTRQKRKFPDLADEVDYDLRANVFSLFLSEERGEKRPDYPDKSPLPLPSQAGKTVPADQLYLGLGYGTRGNIIQALYGAWSPERLIVHPSELGLTGKPEELSDFLSWVGVAEWPREIYEDQKIRGYLDFVLEKIPYPAQFGEYIFHYPKDVKRASLKTVRTLAGLDNILKNSEFSAILAWLAIDSRIHPWTKPQMGHAEFTARCGYDVNLRSYRGVLPSYIRWKIENNPWIPANNNERIRPRDCVLGQRAIEAIFPKPPKPSADRMELFGICDPDLVEGWRQAGVLTSLAELEIDDIYARLLELPKREPRGRSARSLYRWLLDASESALGNGNTAKAHFFEKGLMWGTLGGVSKYFPVRELRHADSEGLPVQLLESLKIVDLPHRVGADKVERVFGVRPIDRMGIEQHVKSFQLAANLDSEFQKAKPFLYLLRTSQTSQAQYLKTLKGLSLNVCFELIAAMKYEGNEFDYSPPVWGWLIEDSVLYVQSDPAEPLDIASDLLADAIGEAIASIFRIGDGGEFARMFLCKDKDRRTLLRRMRGEAAEEDMDKIIAEFGSLDPMNRMATIPAHPIQEPVPITEQPIPEPPTGVGDTGNPSAGEEGMTLAQPTGVPLKIEPKEHSPTNTPIRHKLQIQRTTGGAKKTASAHQVTDWEFCEKKALEFDELFEPPRYPLLVSQIKGSSGFGCDILSFETHEAREDFKSGKNRNTDLILRFIEVKGRKRESGTIEMKGNERSAALNYSTRYYIYRLFKSAINEYQLHILQDPLAQKEALEPAVYVDLRRAKETQPFTLSGGIQESTEEKNTN